MTPINAIAKVRFSSAKAQRVHLIQGQAVEADLLCLESQQEMPLQGDGSVLYVVTGTATLIGPQGRDTLPAGQLVGTDADRTLANISEQRLVCLLLRGGK